MSVFFRVVSEWCGVAWARPSSAMSSFGDANRMAMKCAAEGRKARVYAFAADDEKGLGTVVAEYHPKDGKAVAISL